MPPAAKNKMLPVFLLVFIEITGFGLILPLLAPLFVDPRTGLLPLSTPLGERVMLLGLLLAAFPIAQFFGGPILGALSDRHGRKPLMLASLVGSALGYVLLGLGVLWHNLPLMFIGRLIDGFVGGSISVAYSAVADLSSDKEKAKNFGLLGMAFGLGFIIGPFLGAKLADPGVMPWFDFSTPFFATALLSIVNVAIILLMFNETLSQRSHAKVSLLTGFRNLKRAFELPALRTVFIVVFLLMFGFSFFTQFSQVWLIEEFSFTEREIGDFFAYAGFWIALTQGVLIRPVSSRFRPEEVMKAAPLFLALALFFLLLVQDRLMLYVAVAFISLSQGITFPNYTALVSGLAGKESQGEIFGINQSIQSAAFLLPPIISGFIAAIHPAAPIAAAGFFVLLGWAVFTLFYSRKNAGVFHDVS